MIALVIFCVSLLACIVVSIWYAFTRQKYYDEIFQSVQNSLSWTSENLYDISVSLDRICERGEQE